MYVPKKSDKFQPGINNNYGEYEGIWSGPYPIMLEFIRSSHKTRPEEKVADGYEDVPIRIQRIESDNYIYQIVDGNKRIIRAKRLNRRYIMAYLWEGKYDG